MNILILTGYDDAMASVGDLVAPQHAWYASLHGLPHECVRYYEPGTHPSWQKIRLITERLPHYDAILWLDADVVVTNPQIHPEDFLPHCGLIVSTDWTHPAPEDEIKHFSLGNFLITNCPESFELLRLASLRTEWANRPLWEQQAIQEEYRANPTVRPWVKVLPRRRLNAVYATESTTGPEPWEPGDFLCHFTYLPNEERARLIPGAIVEGFKAKVPHLPAWWETGMCMDVRHLCILSDLASLGWNRGLEIGTWTGCSAAMLLAGKFKWLDLCDVRFTDELHSVVDPFMGVGYNGLGGPGTADVDLYQKRSIEVLATTKPCHYDFILLDGDHSLETGIAESAEMLRLQPRLIVAHDPRSASVGFENCEGPAHLEAELIRDGWTVFVDAKDRPGEVTKRGFLAATKDASLAEKVAAIFSRYAW